MKADFHVHSLFSGDCDAPMEEQIRKAISENIDILCFTDHFDKDYTYTDVDFELDTESYFETVSALREACQDQIAIYTGVELGFRPHLGPFYTDYCKQYPFDFVIGSTHLVGDIDPYYPNFWEGRPCRICIEEYFRDTIKNIQAHDCFDVYGHLDYVNRYVPDGNPSFSYFDYTDLVDECLRLLIQKGKGIEVNSGGYKAGLMNPNPGPDILKRYLELGGEIITTGSDAHFPQYIGYRFDWVYALLKECGFKYMTVFKERKPVFHPL